MPAFNRAPGEIVSAVFASFGGLFLLAFPFTVAPRFGRMFADLGGTLPQVTQLVLSTWFPVSLGLVVLVATGGALGSGLPAMPRRLLITLSLGLALGAILLCMFAMYAPVFTLVDRIQ